MEATPEAGSLICTHVAHPMQQHPIASEAGKSWCTMIRRVDIVECQGAMEWWGELQYTVECLV